MSRMDLTPIFNAILSEAGAMTALLLVLLFWCKRENKNITEDIAKTLERIATILEVRSEK